MRLYSYVMNTGPFTCHRPEDTVNTFGQRAVKNDLTQRTAKRVIQFDTPFQKAKKPTKAARTVGHDVAPERYMYKNNWLGYDVYIRKAHLWMSSFMSAYPQDLYAVCGVMEDWGENMVIHNSWDHYIETPYNPTLVVDFGNDYILWEKDKTLRLRYYGLNFADRPQNNGAHVICNIWFATEKPDQATMSFKGIGNSFTGSIKDLRN